MKACVFDLLTTYYSQLDALVVVRYPHSVEHRTRYGRDGLVGNGQHVQRRDVDKGENVVRPPRKQTSKSRQSRCKQPRVGTVANKGQKKAQKSSWQNKKIQLMSCRSTGVAP